MPLFYYIIFLNLIKPYILPILSQLFHSKGITVKKSIILFFALCVFLLAFSVYQRNPNHPISLTSFEKILQRANIPQHQYQIINKFPHDPDNFTEGLIQQKNDLYESTGLYGQSTLQKTNLNTGQVIKKYSLSDKYFGEGIAIIGEQLFQLTYREHTGFVYDKNTLALQQTFHYAGEGWGLTASNKELIMSNGTDTLLFLNPQTFKITHSLVVTANDKKIEGLNELEYVHGKIYANVWPTSIILIISAENGKVEGWINLRELKPSTGACSLSEVDCVANGVTYNEENQDLLVTGKNWPYFYELRIL